MPQPSRAATITVPSGGNFQAALDMALPGDTIVLAAGATFVGPFTLNDKGGTGTDADWITIRTSAPDSSLPPGGQRITPDFASILPKVVSPGFNEPALRTAPRAHHYRFVGVEFRPVDSNATLNGLIILGDSGPNQDTLEEVPHHLAFDRCLITAFPTQNLKRGITLNSASTDIINSYIAGFKVVGQEAQAINGWNGPGPFKIINNYIEGAGENLMFGGDLASLPNVVPSDIEVKRNHFFKPLSWREGEPSYAGIHWAVKNIFELKNARRVVIDGNVFENNWVDGQDGFAILFTVRGERGAMPWATVEDVQFTNNLLRHTASAINILGTDDLGPAQLAKRITIRNNVFEDVSGARWCGPTCSSGRFLQVLSNAADVTADHNTVFQDGHVISSEGSPSPRFVYTNNLSRRAVGVKGDSKGEGKPTLDQYFPNADFRGNLIYGVEMVIGSTEKPCDRQDQIFCYPTNNFYPPDSTFGGTFEALFVSHASGNYRLAVNNFKGTDGKDVGADINALDAATAGVASPNAPTNLKQSQLDLIWQDNSNNETGFKIESCFKNNGTCTQWQQAGTVGPNVVRFGIVGCEYMYRVRATNPTGDSASSNVVANIAPPCWITESNPPPSEDVVWTNISGVTASGNSIFKSIPSYYWDAGAVSTRSIASGNGYVEITPDNAGTYRMFGLSNGDTNPVFTDIDFAFSLGEGSLAVYEAGVYRGQIGTYVAGDRLRVSVENSVVKYYKNETTLLYTSTVAPVYPLLLDTSISTGWGNVTNAKIAGSNLQGPVTQPVVWTNLSGCTASGNNLYKANQSYYWDAGAVSTKAIASGNGYVEITPDNAGTYRMFGLGNGDTSPVFTDIEFAFALGESSLAVYEAGVYRGQVGTYVAGDKLRVAVEGGVVKYYKNGTLLYTSTVSPTYPLLLDTSLSTSWGNVTNAYISGTLTP